jgi:DNA-binding response OmpR family regulator
MMKAKILLAEDDMSLGFVVSDHLKSIGYDVTLCHDGVEASQRFSQGNFHLLILDVMMPKKDGFTLAEEIRQVNKDIPILFLTAKSMPEDKVAGFKSGGDDYLTKPFNFDEFEMRILSLLKRVNIHPFGEEKTTFEIGVFSFDSKEHKLRWADQEKSLTKKENHILTILCKHLNQVVARDIVLNSVWGQDDYFVGRSLDVFITKLRKYLNEDEKVQIVNVHGVGFKIEYKA